MEGKKGGRGPDLRFGKGGENYVARCSKCDYIYWHTAPSDKKCLRCEAPVIIKLREMNE